MKKGFINFQEKRMQIFGELVKRYWNGNLINSNDLNELAEEIKEKYNFSDEDIPFIKNHIRIAMGLSPRGNEHFDDELEIIKSSKEIAAPIINKIQGACEYCDEDDCKCNEVCKYEAQIYQRGTGPVIEDNKCLTCGECVRECDFGALADKIEFLPLIDLLKNHSVPIYVSVAPAIAGQFGEEVTLGQLRTAFKMIGFEDMIETALFADILSIKEAFEFNELVQKEGDFFLTSCCCPIWFNLTKKHYHTIYEHMSPSVSPMIASGRILKSLYPNAKVVFIAPCIAKKAEVKELELKGAIDFVLNFRELDEIFKALNIVPSNLCSDEKDQASFGGRLYGRTGGVSFSVKTVVNRLEPSRVVKLKSKKVHGVVECKEILEVLASGGEIDSNFIEGMGCRGGCVGGPRTLIDVESATKNINESAEESLIMTPFDNLNVMKILKQLGINSIEEITENEALKKILSRV